MEFGRLPCPGSALVSQKQSYVFPTPYLAASRKFGLWDAVGEPFVFEGPNLEDTFPESLASSVANGVPIG